MRRAPRFAGVALCLAGALAAEQILSGHPLTDFPAGHPPCFLRGLTGFTA